VTTYIAISFADNANKNIPEQLMIFSEHKEAYSSGHSLKLLDIVSKNGSDLGIKTYSYGDFYIVKGDCIAWVGGIDQRGGGKLFIWNPETKNTEEKRIPVELLPPVFYISISPSGDKVAYLIPYGKSLYLGGEPKIGQRANSLGSKSELHIFDLEKNEDYIVTKDAFDWGSPQWSPDDQKIIYTRPNSDNYLNQDYLDRMDVKNNSSWQNLIQSAVFVYDLDKKVEHKICLGIEPRWSHDGNKITFITENNKIGIFNLQNNERTELSTKAKLDIVTFKIAWSLDGKYLAYLGKPVHSLVSYLQGLTKLYERPLSLWIIKTDGTQEEYIQTANFGDIKFAPGSYKILLKDN